MSIEKPSLDLLTGSAFTESYRGISKDVLNLYGFKQASFHGQDCVIEPHVDFETGTEIVAQKLRLPSKQFPSTGNINKAGPFGWHLYKEQKNIYITEGALDAASIYYVLDDHYQNNLIVSLKGGAGEQTAQEIKQYQTIFEERFEKIIICFDMDRSGNLAYKNITKLFSPGKLWRVNFRYKDANEYLKIYQEQELSMDLVNPIQHRPEAIFTPSFKNLLEPSPFGFNIPYPRLNEQMRGIKPGSLYLVGGGSGCGKSSFTKELVYGLLNTYQDLKVGVAYLEEPIKKSAQAFLALDNDKPLYEVSEDPEAIGIKQLKKSYDDLLGNGRVSFVNAAFMSLDTEELLYNLEYLILVEKCKIIVLDHLTMITYDTEGDASERKDIDKLMAALRTLVHKTQASVITVCHLKRPFRGLNWDQGREISMSDFRGSSSLEQLTDVGIGLERNMHDEFQKSKLKVKIIKNRETGFTGYVDELVYLEKTGRLVVL